MTLKTKHRNFVHLVNGFPPNFLTPDLISLIYRALIDTSEQLSKIEPKEPRHLEEVTTFTNQLDALAKSGPAQRVRFDNPQQMKDIRQHLQELLHFVAQQEAQKNINKIQLDAYVDQIKRLSLQMSVDAYLYQGKQAQQANKLRLAVHFFTLAKKLLISENASRAYNKQLEQIEVVIAKLEEKAQIAGEPMHEAEAPSGSTENTTKEWDKFVSPSDDTWKKKNVYD